MSQRKKKKKKERRPQCKSTKLYSKYLKKKKWLILFVTRS